MEVRQDLTLSSLHIDPSTDNASIPALVVDGPMEIGTDGNGRDVTFYSSTSGDNMLWDASAEKLVITGTAGQNALEVAAGNVSVTGALTATLGIRNASVTVSSATSTDIDISDKAEDHKLFLTGTFAADVILPQATANNVGMCIEIFCTVATATSGTIRIGFLNSGSTVMNGIIHLSSTGALMDSIPLDDAKVVLLDADNVQLAGGAEGSIYRFYYQAANAVFAECRGCVTAGTPALAAGAQSTTGIS